MEKQHMQEVKRLVRTAISEVESLPKRKGVQADFVAEESLARVSQGLREAYRLLYSELPEIQM